MIRIDAVFTGLEGLPGISQYYFAGDSQAVADDAANAVSEFHTAIAPNTSTLVTTDVSNIATVVNEETGTIVEYLSVIGDTIQGIGAGDALPIGTSVVFGFQTGLVVRGRRLQGRVYTPGFTEANIPANGVLDAGNVNGLATIAANTLGAATGVHVVWSRPVEGGAPGQVAPVITYRVPSVLSNLRTRRR